jgi:hypothetical protein
MQSELLRFWVPPGSLQATMLVRRADGRLALAGIDARLARAAGIARKLARGRELSHGGELSRGGELAQDERVLLRDLPVALEST